MSKFVHFPAEALERGALLGPRPVSQSSVPMDDEARLRFIGAAIERVVLDSYTKFPMSHRTSAEDLRRATICTTWFNKLVKVHRWTADRALSAMRLVLDDTLSGRAPSPDMGTMWVPDHTLVRGLA